MKIDNLTETHCHIIPNIDDGSNSVEMSLKMIEQLENYGAKAIALTPHYYSDVISYSDFVKKRDDAFEILKENYNGNVKLVPAAEVYVTDYLLHNENLDGIKIAKSNYALLEHSFSDPFSSKTFERLENLYYDFSIVPILAHIERYNSLMSDFSKIEELVDMGCLTQVNISSFADYPRHLRKKLFKLVDRGLVHLVGSDCHNLTVRPPFYDDGIKVILKHFGQSAVDEFMKNAEKIVF